MRIKYEYVSGGLHPVVGEVLYPIQRVIDGAEVERYQRYLASPIGSVARDLAACLELEAAIARVQAGELPSIHLDYDEIELAVTPLGVQCNINVSDEWVDNPDGRIGLGVWQQALEAWRRFLALPKSLESSVEIEF